MFRICIWEVCLHLHLGWDVHFNGIHNRSHFDWDVYFGGWDVHFEMHIWGSHLHFDCNVHILEEMCIWRTHLYLYFGCNVHILEDVRAFGGSHLNFHLGCNVHLFLRRCILKYNFIHMFTEKITLIKYYCNPYHISSRT